MDDMEVERKGNHFARAMESYKAGLTCAFSAPIVVIQRTLSSSCSIFCWNGLNNTLHVVICHGAQ